MHTRCVHATKEAATTAAREANKAPGTVLAAPTATTADPSRAGLAAAAHARGAKARHADTPNGRIGPQARSCGDRPAPEDSAADAAARLTTTNTSVLGITEARGSWSRAATEDEHPAVFMKKKKKSRTLVQKDEVRKKIARWYAAHATARSTMPARGTA